MDCFSVMIYKPGRVLGHSADKTAVLMIQYGRHTASSSLAVVAMLVGELLWLPSVSTTSFWFGRLGLRRVDPVEALVQGGRMRGGDLSPPDITENWWYDPADVP